MLIPASQNRYTDIIQNEHVQPKDRVPPKTAAAKILHGLNRNDAKGPHMLPTKMLRECADVLAKPIRILAVLIFLHGILPKTKMTHWIVQRFKNNKFSSR